MFIPLIRENGVGLRNTYFDKPPKYHAKSALHSMSKTVSLPFETQKGKPHFTSHHSVRNG